MGQKVKAVRIHAYGGIDQLKIEEISLPEPGAHEVLIRHTAIGLNYTDIHNRTGRYPLPFLPHVLGVEGVGVIERTGPGVDEFQVGDRVAYAAGGPAIAPGSYCEARVMSTQYLIAIPDEIDDASAAGMMLKGLTAQYLIKSVYSVGPSDTILVHAASGGVGQILCQWARYLGAHVIGVVGSAPKVDLALRNGCHHVLIRQHDDLARRVRQLTAGEGVSVVFDSVGKDTYMDSLACLKQQGTLVSFGTSSGPIPPFDLFLLNRMGSLSITSPAFVSFFKNREAVIKRSHDLISMVLRGVIRVQVRQTFALDEAAQAHQALESRQTQGATVLLP